MNIEKYFLFCDLLGADRYLPGINIGRLLWKEKVTF